ncbi:MAG TPA: hypothetical protein VF111_06435 [Thermoanaerobaculia bacterium]
MSVLSFPRLYFQGYLSWDPNVTNNSGSLWDPVDVNVVLPTGVTLDTYEQFVVDQASSFGIWNIFGSHACDFVQFQSFTSRVTGGALADGISVKAGDAVLGQSLSMPGRLVDLNPLGVDTSQYFFDRFSIGSLLSAPRSERMHSRWINFRRNLNVHKDPNIQIAGVAAVVWQTTFPTKSLTLNCEGSKLLTAFHDALALGDVRGLMVRFSAYRTLYYQNGIFNDIKQQPRNQQDLQTLYNNGEMFFNPAYSVVTGTVGLWTRNDVATVPNGRYLLPNTGTTTQPTGLGPVVCGYNAGLGLLSLDFGAAIPEVDFPLTKQTFGTLTVSAGGTQIAQISESQYDKSSYEATGGIIDVQVSDPSPLIAGLITITGTQNGQPITMFSEAGLTAQTSTKNVYLDETGSADITVYVADTGRPAAAGTQVQVARYPASQRGGTVVQTLTVGAKGLASFKVSATVAGYDFYRFVPFRAGTTPPPPPPRINGMTDFYCGVRTLPFDDQLNRNTPDSQLTWDWVYTNILQPFDLCPAAAMRALKIGLDEKTIWDNPKGAARIKAATAAANFDSTGYMPITRELSRGLRTLLHRWADLVIAGKEPTAKATESVHPPATALIREAR